MRTAKANVDLTTTLGSVTLPNPVMTASGTAGYGSELSEYMDLQEIGAIVVKSLHADKWEGNLPPRLHPTPSGMLNSVGLQGPGVKAWIDEKLPSLRNSNARIVASIWGSTVEEFAEAAFSMEVGEISEPVKTQFGYHIIKVTGKVEGKDVSYEDVADIVDFYFLERKKEALLKGLYEKAEIEITL